MRLRIDRNIRPIRSFVLRQGRITQAQRRALDDLLPRYGIPFGEKIASPRKAPLVVEIGSGMGETTAAIAAAHPEADFVAIEVHSPGVGSLLKRVEAAKLANVRVIRHDALEVLERMVDDGSLAAIHLFFPDPWPKKRHHKRRLVRAETASLMAHKLAPSAVLHIATDWPDYAEHIATVLGAEPLLEPAESGFAVRPETKFESRGKRLGHRIRDLYFRRRAA